MICRTLEWVLIFPYLQRSSPSNKYRGASKTAHQGCGNGPIRQREDADDSRRGGCQLGMIYLLNVAFSSGSDASNADIGLIDPSTATTIDYLGWRFWFVTGSNWKEPFNLSFNLDRLPFREKASIFSFTLLLASVSFCPQLYHCRYPHYYRSRNHSHYERCGIYRLPTRFTSAILSL